MYERTTNPSRIKEREEILPPAKAPITIHLLRYDYNYVKILQYIKTLYHFK